MGICHWLWRQHLSAADYSTSQWGSVWKAHHISCFPHVTRTKWDTRLQECKKTKNVLDQTLATFVCLSADWLQVHAVDEVIRLLCGEGSSFLQFVTDESEATADHEQQQSSDDQAERQRKDRTWRMRQEESGEWSNMFHHKDTGHTHTHTQRV